MSFYGPSTFLRRVAFLAALLVFALPGAGILRAQTFYSSGNPSSDEQFLLELINRARANPPAEGVRLGRTVEFAGYAARPPLAFHPALLRAAENHTNDMEVNNFFAHAGSDGSQPGGRAVAAGYPGSANSVGENVAFGFPTPLPAYVALMIDDGVPGLEHRRNFLEFSQSRGFFREVGIAIGNPPRYFDTQDFAFRAVAFVTGVAFQDGDGDNFYTPGEGIGGVSISSPQSSFVTATSASGGYALPLDKVQDPAAGVMVVFREPSGATYTRRVALTSITGDGAPDNVKSDLRVGLDIPDAVVFGGTVSVVGAPSRGGFVLSRQGDPSQALTVLYHNGGSAIRDGDYVAFSGVATFGAGQAETVIPVQLLPGANRGKKVKVFLDPSPVGAYGIGKAQSKVFLSDLP